MLSDFDWADRMAIPLPFIQAVGSPDAAAFMSALTAWRWTAPQINRSLWFNKVIVLRAPPPAITQRGPQDQNRSAFFDALLHKYSNLYRSNGTAADPLALARHPWTLTPREFQKNYEEITSGDVPDAAIDERRSMSAKYGLIAAAPSLSRRNSEICLHPLPPAYLCLLVSVLVLLAL